MRAILAQWTSAGGWVYDQSDPFYAPDWILYFGGVAQLEKRKPVNELWSRFPRAICCGCSTSGEILDGHLLDGTIVAALVKFASARVRAAEVVLASSEASREAGRDVARQLNEPELRHVLVLSDGLLVNGSQLVAGICEAVGSAVTVTGGLAGDATRFARTLTGLGAEVRGGQVVAIGFYGAALRVGCGEAGGWTPFGPYRMITRSRNSVLYELDGVPALDLYKRYLGERAAGLPATGLLFPLEVLAGMAETDGLVRTIQGVDESARSLTFAGDMPEGKYVRFMKASHAGLVAGAGTAAQRVAREGRCRGDRLAILVSCVGRRMVLGMHTEEELDAAAEGLPEDCKSVGFYSYGEICPSAGRPGSQLHNQTLAVTMLAEDA